MSTLSTLILSMGIATCLSGLPATVPANTHAPAGEVPAPGDAGYFFSLREIPLSQKQYIFLADPLKKATFYDAGKNVVLSHTMTVKNSKGFDMYFSAADYNVILAVKEAKALDEGTIGYKGTLLIRHGSEKHKFAVHGFQNR